MSTTRAGGLPEVTDVLAPVVDIVEDADADTFWCAGHVDPRLFVRSMVRYHRDNYDDESASLLLREVGGAHALLDRVRHATYRYDNPNDDESMAECAPDAIGAESFTEVRL